MYNQWPFSRVRRTIRSFLAAIAVAYNHEALDVSKAAESPTQSQGAVYSFELLSKLLAPGTLTNVVIDRVGKPESVTRNERGILQWRYSLKSPLPGEGVWSDAYAFGFRLEITNGAVENLKYDYATYPGSAGINARYIESRNASIVAGEHKLPNLELFIVKDEPFPGAIYVDTQQNPKLGYVSARPDLSITSLKDAAIDAQRRMGHAGQSATNWSFAITLTPPDARVLNSLTLSHAPCRILIKLNKEYLAAPWLFVPLKTNDFVFDCSDPDVAKELYNALAKMLPANPPRKASSSSK